MENTIHERAMLISDRIALLEEDKGFMDSIKASNIAFHFKDIAQSYEDVVLGASLLRDQLIIEGLREQCDVSHLKESIRTGYVIAIVSEIENIKKQTVLASDSLKMTVNFIEKSMEGVSVALREGQKEMNNLPNRGFAAMQNIKGVRVTGEQPEGERPEVSISVAISDIRAYAEPKEVEKAVIEGFAKYDKKEEERISRRLDVDGDPIQEEELNFDFGPKR